MSSEQYQTKSEVVYTALRQEILSGTRAPGERLPLVELANRFQLSTIPVREALKMLSRDRLVTIETHKGATVAKLFDSAVYDLIDIRLWLEIRAAELALPFQNEKNIEEMTKFCKSMRELAMASQGVKFSQMNRKFHTCLYEPGPNLNLLRQISDIWDRVWLSKTGSIVEVDRERMLQVCDEHENILEAVSARDSAALFRAMELHMQETLRCWRRITADHEAEQTALAEAAR